ncbi:hypothetical protein ACIRNU_34625 [Streptomyces rochei]|uniref:hypothetical protein n=1 Tax=Streptomyces rochei TaxID=1928 RepID=UPI003808C49E
MRAPAQHRQHRTDTGWDHPYTGTAALAVFYNDGGDPTPPTPADIPPKKPAPAPVSDGDTVVMPQDKFTQNMTEQRRRGRHAAYREIAEAAGIDFDVDTFDPKAFAQSFKEAQAARQAMLTEEQRRAEELAQKEQALAAREAAAAQREAEAAQAARQVKIRSALVKLGATGDDLEDAAALLRVPDDADDDAITQAADALKARRGELFGTPTPKPSNLPPAPGGAPAAGASPRTTPTKDDVKARAQARAQKMGYAKPSAA